MNFKSKLLAIIASATSMAFAASNSNLNGFLSDDKNATESPKSTSSIKKPKRKVTPISKKIVYVDEHEEESKAESVKPFKPTYPESTEVKVIDNNKSNKKKIKNSFSPEVKVNAIAAAALSNSSIGTMAIANVSVTSCSSSLLLNMMQYTNKGDSGNATHKKYLDFKQSIGFDAFSISPVGSFTQYDSTVYTLTRPNTTTYKQTIESINALSIGFIVSRDFMESFTVEVAPLYYSRNGTTQDSFSGLYFAPSYLYKFSDGKTLKLEISYDTNNITLGTTSDNAFDPSRPTNYSGVIKGKLEGTYESWKGSVSFALGKNNDTKQNDTLFGGVATYNISSNVEFFAQYENRQQNTLYTIGVKTPLF